MWRLSAPCTLVAGLGRRACRSGRGLEDGNSVRELSTFVYRCRALSSIASGDADEKIVAAVLLERLPVVLPPLSPAVSAFRQFSFDWQQQYRRHYPQEFLEASANRGEFDESAAFEPGPTITEADRTNDHRSLQRALDKRLYLILYGISSSSRDGKPLWHFPEKVYSKEPSLRQVLLQVEQIES